MIAEKLMEFEKIHEQPMLPNPDIVASTWAWLRHWMWTAGTAFFTFLAFLLLCYSLWRFFDRPDWNRIKGKGRQVKNKIQEGVHNTFSPEHRQTNKQKLSDLAETSKRKAGEFAETGKQKMADLKKKAEMTPEERLKAMTVISLVGPPGVGKSALSRHITPDFDIVWVSTGELIRTEIANKTPLGLRVQAEVNRGKLLPDDLVAGIIERKLKEIAEGPDTYQGVLLDGFPRRLSQAELLDNGQFDIPPLAAVISITMPDEVLDLRRSGRRICPKCATTYNLHEVAQEPYHLRARMPDREGKCVNDGSELISRADDETAIADARMREYHLFTPPVVDWYRHKGILIEVEKQRQMKQIYKMIKPELEQLVMAQKAMAIPAVALSKAGAALEFGKEKAGQATELAKEKAGPALDYAKEKAGQAAEFVKEKAGSGVAFAKEKAVHLKEAVVDRKSGPASKFKDTSNKAGGVDRDADQTEEIQRARG